MVRVASTIALLATAGAGVEAFQAPNVGYSQAVAHQPIARAFSRRSRAAATTLHPGDDVSIAEEEERQVAVPEIPTIEEVGLDVSTATLQLSFVTHGLKNVGLSRPPQNATPRRPAPTTHPTTAPSPNSRSPPLAQYSTRPRPTWRCPTFPMC